MKIPVKLQFIKEFSLLFILLFLLSACGMFDFLDADMNKAINKKDPKICLKMTGDSARRERCLSAVAETKEDPQVCELIESEKEKDFCFSKVAIIKKDAGICESILGESKKGICYATIALEMKDENLCEKISGKRTQGSCYSDIAIEKNDENICDRIKDLFKSSACYSKIAENKKDVNICEKIKGRKTSLNNCITAIAKQAEDELICLKIEEGSNKDRCLSGIKAETSVNPEDEVNINEEVGEKEYGVIEKDGNLYLNSKPGEVLSIDTEDLPDWAREQIATVGASIAVVGSPGLITEGDSNVLLNGLPVARLGDGTSFGGTIIEGSKRIFVNGQPVAFIGGQTVDPMVTGTVPHVGGPITSNPD